MRDMFIIVYKLEDNFLIFFYIMCGINIEVY